VTEPRPEYLEGVVCHKKAPNDTLITVIPLTYSRGRINRGGASGAFYDSGW